MGGRSASAGGGVSSLGGGAAGRRVVCGGLVAGGGAAGGRAAAGGAVESESGSKGCGRGNCTCVWGRESGSGGGAGGAQNPPTQHGGLGQHADDPLAQLEVRQYPVEEAKRLRALNALRQKSLVEDTNKLLKLAAELNAEVASEHPDELTPEQLRKLAEIEKLARGVREKMSAPVWGAPVYPQPFSPSFH